MAEIIKADAQRLREYAKRVHHNNERLRIIANQINGRKYDLIHKSFPELIEAWEIGDLHKNRYRLEAVEKYLYFAADEVDSTSQILLSKDIFNFQKPSTIEFMFAHIDKFIILSDDEKSQFYKELKKMIGKISPEAKEDIEVLEKLMKTLQDPVEGSQIVLDECIDIAKEYLKVSGFLNEIGIDCFFNMVKAYPEALISGQQCFEGTNITDMNAWGKYFLYLGDKVVYEPVLITASEIIKKGEGYINDFTGSFAEGAENILSYFGIETDISIPKLSIDKYYEEQTGLKGVEGYKKAIADLTDILVDEANHSYHQIADNIDDYLKGSCKLLGNSFSAWGDTIGGLFS